MISTLRKFAAIFISFILLCSCTGNNPSKSTEGRKQAAFNESGKKAESSIFGRNIAYDAYFPASDTVLPISSDKISDMVQVEKRLYLLGDGAVYTLDIESGKSDKLFDTDSTMLASHGDKLYTYSAETSVLSEYDTSGIATKELTLEVTGVDSVEGLAVTDDYYVFLCTIPGAVMMEPHLFVYSRGSAEFILSKKTRVTRVYPYKGNKVLTVTMGSVFPSVDLNVFDAETGKSELLRNLGSDSELGSKPGVVYCPKTDTVLAFGHGVNLDGDTPVCITEFSLDDEDKMILNRYYLDVSYETEFFLSVYENIVSAISTTDSNIRIYDYLNPPDSITILGYDTVQDVVYSFEKETGILVKDAYTDFDKLVLKLMAGDDDFDIFNTSGAYHNYVDSGAYVNLKEIESLNSRISNNAAADLVVSYDGKYFGVPVHISNIWTEENYPEDGSKFSYSLVVSEAIYFARNVDVAEQRYSDPDGDELYKLFEFLNDNPEGSRKKMPFGDDATILNSNVYMLNPKSRNYDNAVRFLEYLFDAYNGDIPGIVPEADLYPILESTQNCYVEWRCRPIDIISPIMETRNTILNQNGDLSNSDLKKMAKEAAAEVAMRIGE